MRRWRRSNPPCFIAHLLYSQLFCVFVWRFVYCLWRFVYCLCVSSLPTCCILPVCLCVSVCVCVHVSLSKHEHTP
jgi:hypothetical protein